MATKQDIFKTKPPVPRIDKTIFIDDGDGDDGNRKKTTTSGGIVPGMRNSNSGNSGTTSDVYGKIWAGEPKQTQQTPQTNYFPGGQVPSYYGERTDWEKGAAVAPNGDALPLHDWSRDTTDYSTLMLNAQSAEEFQKYAQDRAHKAAAQGIDISGATYRSNEDLYNEWYAKTGPKRIGYQGGNGQPGVGYYGMDGNGNWGYYDDPELTRKSANGNWDSYRASDGGKAIFAYDGAGRLTPETKRDTSRAGQTVTLATGSKAFEVTYDDFGYVRSVKPVTVDTSSLPVARYDPANDRGVSGRDILRQQTGHTFVGPGGLSQSDVRPATREDYAAIMAGQEYSPSGYSDGVSQYGGVVSGGYTGGTAGGTFATTGGALPGGSLEDELRRLYYGENSEYMRALEELRKANEAALSRTQSEIEGRKRDLDTSYADLFRQLYIDRMNDRRDIEQELAYRGITGGAAESTRLGLATQYADALRQGEQGRLGALNALDRELEQARLTGDLSTAQQASALIQDNVNRYADALRSLIAQRNTDRAFDYQRRRDAVSDARYDDQLAYQRQQDAYNQLAADQSAYENAQTKPTLTAAQVNTAIKAGNLTPSVLSAYEYYYGVPYGSAGTGTYTATAGDGSTYTVGSDMGVRFIRSAAPGETMTGRDGSVWVKSEDGTTIITTPDGKSYFVR